MTDLTFPILGLDYGTVRLGVAIAQTSLAEPYQVLPMNDQIFDQILAICQKEKIKLIVVGESEGTMAEKSRAFGQTLASHCQLPVVFSDETLTSHDSLAKLRQIGKQTKQIDHYAACEMLQNYLDTMETHYAD